MKEKKMKLVKDGNRAMVAVFGIDERNVFVYRKPSRFVVCLGCGFAVAVFKNKKDALDRFYKRLGYLVAHGYRVDAD